MQERLLKSNIYLLFSMTLEKLQDYVKMNLTITISDRVGDVKIL